MKTIQSVAAPARPGLGAFSGVTEAFRAWVKRRREMAAYRMLLDYDEHMLNDVGITRGMLRRELMQMADRDRNDAWASR